MLNLLTSDVDLLDHYKELPDYFQVVEAVLYLFDSIEFQDGYHTSPRKPPEACFDLGSGTPGCRVPFGGGLLSHQSRNGTGVALLGMRTDIRVRDLTNPSSRWHRDSRWNPEQGDGEQPGDGKQPAVFQPAENRHTDPWTAYHSGAGDTPAPDDIVCGLEPSEPHVELVITEMWPDQHLGSDGHEFIDEFKDLFGEDSLDWWGLDSRGLPCKATDFVRECAGIDDPDDSRDCGKDWTVGACRRRLTELQDLRYLPDLIGGDLDEGDKKGEIKSRNQRVTCTVRGDPMNDELDIHCPWQPSRSGYFRIAAVAIWEIKHCNIRKSGCGAEEDQEVPYGAMAAMTVSEPLSVVVYSATSEGRSVAPEENLNFGD